MLQWKKQNLDNYTNIEDFAKALNLEPNCMEVKLADFGFARILTHYDKANQQYGSPYYMAPEVLATECFCSVDGASTTDHICDSYDFKADIWSLGILLYEMLNISSPKTKYPFQGSNIAEV
jgi:serine/threonine protein kinase